MKVGTKNFTLREFEFSQVAAQKGIDNTLPEELYEDAQRVLEALQEIRDALGFPIYISSGYRCPLLNATVGGAINSLHQYARAADIICPHSVSFEDFADAIRWLVAKAVEDADVGLTEEELQRVDDPLELELRKALASLHGDDEKPRSRLAEVEELIWEQRGKVQWVHLALCKKGQLPQKRDIFMMIDGIASRVWLPPEERPKLLEQAEKPAEKPAEKTAEKPKTVRVRKREKGGEGKK